MNSISEKKSALRRKINLKSSQIKNKSELDKAIFDKLIYTEAFKNAQTVLTYYSMPGEPDTLKIIDYCFENKKKVALPVCYGNGIMDFFTINSLDDVASGKYSIPEPVYKSKKVIPDSSCVCIFPALSFDKSRNRLGKGGGYYDRYLRKHAVGTIGLCYEQLIEENIPVEGFDIKADIVITDKNIY